MQLPSGLNTSRIMAPVGPSFDEQISPDFAYYPSSATPTNRTPQTQTASGYYYTGDGYNAMWDYLFATFYYTPGPPWSECINSVRGYGGNSWESMTYDSYWGIYPTTPSDADAGGDCTQVEAYSSGHFMVQDEAGQCYDTSPEATFSTSDFTKLSWDENTGNPYLSYRHSNNIEGSDCWWMYADFGWHVLYEMPGTGDIGSA